MRYYHNMLKPGPKPWGGRGVKGYLKFEGCGGKTHWPILLFRFMKISKIGQKSYKIPKKFKKY